MNLGIAIAITAQGFKSVLDKGNQPYILHCLRVMNSLNTDDWELKAIAVMHDNIEDGICTVKELIDLGFSNRVIYTLMDLTHNKKDSYENYIKKISLNEDAVKIKLADLKDNSDITRLKGLTKKDFDRIEKYHKAYVYLSKL